MGTDEETLQQGMAKYEPKEVDITICVDDTLCKGVESWAWYGLQPVNKLLKPGGTLIVTSLESPETIIGMAHRKDEPYKLAILKGTPSFSGLWVFKDDHTDVRILGAIAKLLPELFSLKAVQDVIVKEWKDPVKAESAARSHERITTSTVKPKHPISSNFPNGMKWARALPFRASLLVTVMRIPTPMRWADSGPIAIPRSKSSPPARCGRS